MASEFSPSRPIRVNAVSRWDFEADVIVVGFGAAGSCAAIEAARAGAKVIIFEVAGGFGGSAILSGGEVYVGGHGGTDIQRANGFSDETEDLYNYLMMAGGPDAPQAKVRLYADNALDHFNWMKAQGVPYKGTYLPGKWTEPETDDTLIWSGSEAAWPFNTVAKPCPRGHAAQWPGYGGGKPMMEALAAQALKAGVEAHYNARALCLIADDANRVHGVVVRIDGEPRFARARKGVVLSAGGFVMNKGMLRRYAPKALKLMTETSGGNDDGSGIRMGMSVGGAAIHMEQFFSTLPFFPPGQLVKGIFVNEMGQRYINEDSYHGRISTYSLKQPTEKLYLLVDSEIFVRPAELAKMDIVATGDTWDEVESELGMPKGMLTSTVELFNHYAQKGEDPLFHKSKDWLKPLTTPPYAAFNASVGEALYTYFTLGGLDTLPTGEVLSVEGEPISGLYAAGRTVCGLPRWDEGYSSGMSLGDSTFFGRMAGKQVATAPAR